MIAFVFFILMSIPTDAAYYVQLVGMDWTSLHYRDLYDLARFSSGFRWLGNTLFGNPLMGYANWWWCSWNVWIQCRGKGDQGLILILLL